VSFERRISAYHKRLEASLDRWLPPASRPPGRLHEAMRYAVLGTGKRFRPLLIYAVGEALRIPAERLDAPACAVEIIHAYSLIHDDLPAMDDDDLRRGRATCHRAFDEATAILAGDALQVLAFHILTRDKALAVDADTRLAMLATLAVASGSEGMAGGQALDLSAIGQRLELTELEFMHILRTTFWTWRAKRPRSARPAARIWPATSLHSRAFWASRARATGHGSCKWKLNRPSNSWANRASHCAGCPNTWSAAATESAAPALNALRDAPIMAG
jgi:hypothetical protein